MNNKLIAIKIELPIAYAMECVVKTFLSLLMIISRYAFLYSSSVMFDDIVILLSKFLIVGAADSTAPRYFAFHSIHGPYSNR